RLRTERGASAGAGEWFARGARWFADPGGASGTPNWSIRRTSLSCFNRCGREAPRRPALEKLLLAHADEVIVDVVRGRLRVDRLTSLCADAARFDQHGVRIELRWIGFVECGAEICDAGPADLLRRAREMDTPFFIPPGRDDERHEPIGVHFGAEQIV